MPEPIQFTRRDVLKTLAGCAAWTLGVACSAPGPSAPTVSAGLKGGVSGAGTVVLANFTEATGFNPYLSTEGASQIIWELMFEGLVRPDLQTGAPSAWLADSWQATPDGLNFTFHLHPNVTWSDGQPLTADDVKFTFEMVQDPASKSPIRSQFDKIRSVAVADPLTVNITLTEPYCPFLTDILKNPILPRHVLAQSGGLANEGFSSATPVGTGPYLFKEWQRDDHITLVANPNYWRGKPKIDQWIRKVVKDVTVVVAQLRSGELDYAYFPIDSLDEIRSLPQYHVLTLPVPGFEAIGYNLDRPLLQDKRVRQALTHALDRDTYFKTVVQGQGQQLDGPIAPSSWAFDPQIPRLGFDQARARALLAEAGWQPGADGIMTKNETPFRMTMLVQSSDRGRSATVTVAQDQFRAIGVQVDPLFVESSTFQDRLRQSHDFDAVCWGWTTGVDPDQTSIWSSAAYQSGSNYLHYANAQVDQLLEQGRTVASCDPAARKPMYAQFQQIVADDQPATFLYRPLSFIAARTTLQGMMPTEYARPAWNIYAWSWAS